MKRTDDTAAFGAAFLLLYCLVAGIALGVMLEAKRRVYDELRQKVSTLEALTHEQALEHTIERARLDLAWHRQVSAQRASALAQEESSNG